MRDPLGDAPRPAPARYRGSPAAERGTATTGGAMSGDEGGGGGSGGGGGEEAGGAGAPAAAGGGAAAATAGATDAINLKVAGPDGHEVYFKIKRSTPFKKLMDAYCQRQGVEASQVRFLWEGQRVAPQQTPRDLDLEDEDCIDAVLMQTGGGAAGGV